jgi:hypothetical protein
MSQEVIDTIATSVPILLLIGAGVIVRKIKLLSERGLEEIKSLIVNAALPAAFFVTFLTVEFDTTYLGLFLFVPAILFVMLLVGYLADRLPLTKRPTPFLMTGFEFGMLGIGLFTTAYGMSNFWSISVVALPHEIFVWFVLVTLMKARYGGPTDFRSTLISFARSPIIIAILSGLLLNLTGLTEWFTTALVPRSFVRALEMLSNIIGPLILIVVGFGTRISLKGLGEAAPVMLIRGALIVLIAGWIAPFVSRELLGLPRIFSHAIFTFLVLPPPYIVPLYIPSSEEEDLAYSNNVLSSYTVISIVAFLIYYTLNPA